MARARTAGVEDSSSHTGVRVAIVAGSLACVLVVLGAVWQVAESRAALRAEAVQDELANAQLLAGALAQELSRYLDLTESVARRPVLIDQASNGAWEVATRQLRDLRRLVPAFSNAALLDGAGTLRTIDPSDPSVLGRDFSFREYFAGAVRADRAYLSDVFVRAAVPPAPVVAFASAVPDDSGAPLAVLVAALPLSELSSLVAGDLGIRRRSVQVFDRAGHELTRPEADVTASFASHPVVASALAGRSGAGELTVPRRPDRRLVAFAPVSPFGWAVLVDQGRSSAYGPLGGLSARLAATTALAILTFGIAVVVGGRLLRRLEREQDRSAAILASIADGVVIVEPDGRVAAMNPAMERLTGCSAGDLLGLHHTEALTTFDRRGKEIPWEERIVARAMDSRTAVSTQGYGLSLATRDGRRIPVSIAAAPILDASDHVLGGVAVVRDVSHEVEVDQLKSALVSTVSHELRTPLTMIRGFAELLTTRDLKERQSREALQQISASAERLSRLIDDLLSVSRMESGRLVVRVESVELAHAVGEAIAALPPDREARVQLNGATTALADPDMLIQILTNLISNAVKYSPPGCPVFVEARRVGATVEVSVGDEGIGLSESEISHLFEKFYRVERAEVRRVGGTGLGLYITKHLVELQGGQIWVRSEPAQGSTFTFTLPASGPDGGMTQ